MDESNVNKTPQNNNLVKFIFLIVAALVVLYMTFFRNGSSNNGCTVVPQSPFGQSQQQVWVDLDDASKASIIAGFDLVVPSELTETYTNISYRAYTKQINEMIFYDDNGEKVIQIDKADYCGLEILDTDDDAYSSIQKMDVQGIEVKERGNSDGFTAISFVKGDYSYGITCFNEGLTEEQVIQYVLEIE